MRLALYLLLGCIIVSLLFSSIMLSLPRKQLSYEILTQEQTTNEIPPDLDLTIEFNGQEFTNIEYTRLILRNTGNKNISKDDFNDRIVVEFSPSASIVEAQATVSGSDNAHSHVEYNENKVYIDPFTIEQEQKIIIAIFSGNSLNSDPVLTSNINGIDKVVIKNIDYLSTGYFIEILLFFIPHYFINFSILKLGLSSEKFIKYTLVPSSVFSIFVSCYRLSLSMYNIYIFILYK